MTIADEYADAFRKKAAELGATNIRFVHDGPVLEMTKEAADALVARSATWFREKLAELPPFEFRAEPTTLGKWRSA